MTTITILADAHIKSTDEYLFYRQLIQHITSHMKVVLLGDIFDFVKVSHLDVNYDVNDFNSNKNIVYVYGNHDVIAPNLGFNCVESYQLHNTLFIHGHQLEVLSNSTGFTLDEYSSFFKRLSYLRCTANIFPKLLYKLWDLYGKLMCNQSEETADEIFSIMLKRGNIVVGHTHKFKFSSVRRCLMCGSARKEGYIYDVVTNRVIPFDIKIGNLHSTTQSFSEALRKLSK